MIRNYTNHRQKPQLWVEILITVFGVLGVIIFFALYETALPDASVDVSISRGQAEQAALEYLNRLGYAVEGYEFALSFSSDSQAAIYLQRTLGIEEYNSRLALEHWPIYYWSARWFKPQQKEEFRIYLAPDGRFLGLNHIIKEDSPGASIPQADAQSIAEIFLTGHVDWKSDEWQLVESSSQTKTGGRVDHTFTWKSKEFSAAEGELRCTAVVNGDQVGYEYSYIKVPESFIRQFAAERNTAIFIDNIADYILIFGCLIIGLLTIFLSRPDIHRAAIPALLVAGVALAAYLNSLPLYKSYYGTTENYSLFWIDLIGSIFFISILTGAQVLILLLGAQSLMKFVWPRQDRILARGNDRWMDFSRSAWRGLMLGGLQMAYVVLFYTVTKNYLGWWSPVRSEYSDIFATPFPFFYAFDIGLSAAVIEELSVRFIGIGFLLWLLRSKYKWFAVLIPSIIWAFAHTSYITSPIYARGIELTLVALFLSFIFLKFDLLTTIMSHFTYNMMVVGIVLLRSSERYYQISGWIVVLTLVLPLIPGLYLTIRRRLRNEPAAPESLILSSLEKSDFEQLSALPIKADWQALANQANRSILCLRAGTQIVGFATGFIDDNKIGYVDGVYVKPKWQRQYWGSTLMDAIHETLTTGGASEVRMVLKTHQNRMRSFLHNIFWRNRVLILRREESEQTFKAALKFLFKNLKRERVGENELEIPGNLI
jgi:hypothetical protein